MPNLKKCHGRPIDKKHERIQSSVVRYLDMKMKFAFMIGVIGALMASGCVNHHYSNPSQGVSKTRLVGVGYAVINAQPGNSPEEKRLMAIKASKLEAYKSIAEQLYGQYVESRGTLSNLKMGQEELVSRVEGLIVGARVVSIKPISADSYETVLELGQPEDLEPIFKDDQNPRTSASAASFTGRRVKRTAESL